MDDSVGNTQGRVVSLRTPLVIPALIFVGLAYTAFRVLWAIQIHRLQNADGNWRGLIETLNTYRKVFPLLALVASVLLVIVLVGAYRKLSGRWRAAVVVALVALGVGMLIEGAWWAANIFETKNPTIVKILLSKWTGALMGFGKSVGIALGVACVLRLYGVGPVSARLNPASPLFVWGAWGVLLAFGQLLAERPFRFRFESPVTYMLIEQAVWISGFVLVVLALRRERDPEETSMPERSADPEDNAYYDRWSPAADGLRLYGDALGWRLAAMVMGYSLLLFALLGKSPGLAKLVMWALPTAGVITGIAMLVGVFKYASQPDESPGKSPALFAAIAMCVMALLDGYALLLVFKFLTADPKSYTAAMEAQKSVMQAQSMTTWAMGLGFTALVVLLASMGMVASYLRRADVVKALVNAGIFLMVAAGVVLWFRADPPRIKSVSELVFLSMIIVIIAVSALGYYISTVRKVEDALRGYGGEPIPDLPSARVVNKPPSD